MHASGTLQEVVAQAIAKGFTVYGLTEHMPRSRVQDLYPEEIEVINCILSIKARNITPFGIELKAGMSPQDTLKAYTAFYSEARALQAKHKDQITLVFSALLYIIIRSMQY